MQTRVFFRGWPFGMEWSHIWLSLPRVFSLKFLQQLKTTLLGRAGVGSASE